MAKLPSGRFPFINLTKALERAQAFFENDKGGKGLRVPVAFAAWGYSDKSSGGFQTVGALKQYGLVEDEGSNDDRTVKLTGDARHYFLTEIEEDKRKLRAKFASRPSLMKHLLDEWDNGTKDDAVARSYLKTVIGLNDQSARSALGIYKENLVHIEAAPSVAKEEVAPPSDKKSEPENGTSVQERLQVQPPKSIRVGDRVQCTVNGADQFEVPRIVTNVFCDPQHGWFVSVQGEKGSIPMEQVTVADVKAPPKAPSQDGEGRSANPIEIFLAANGRLQITADIDREGVDKLRTLLDKYADILDLLS